MKKQINLLNLFFIQQAKSFALVFGLLITLGLSVVGVMSIASFNMISLNTTFIAIFGNLAFIVLVVLAAKILGEDYQSRTANYLICSGYSQLNILIMKLLTYLILCIIFSLVLCLGIFMLSFLYPMDYINLDFFIQSLITYFFVGLFLGSLSILINVLVKSYPKTLIILFFAVLTVGTVLISLIIEFIGLPELLSYLPVTYMIKNITLLEVTTKEMISTSIFSLIFMAIAYYRFKKNGSQ